MGPGESIPGIRFVIHPAKRMLCDPRFLGTSPWIRIRGKSSQWYLVLSAARSARPGLLVLLRNHYDLPTRSGSSGIVRSAGTAIAAEEEDRFDGLCVISPMMATSFAFASAPAECLARHGVHPRQARNYVAHIYMGLGRTTVEAPSRSFAELAADRTTRGGTNEQAPGYLRQHGVLRPIRRRSGCDPATRAGARGFRLLTAGLRLLGRADVKGKYQQLFACAWDCDLATAKRDDHHQNLIRGVALRASR